MKKIIFTLFKIIAIPILLFLTFVTLRALFSLPGELIRNKNMIFCILGFASGCILFSTICQFKPIYVFGHELAHWFFAKLFFRKTSGFTVRANSGSVKVENPNIWIVLAPYFFPTWTLIWLCFYPLFSSYVAQFPKIMNLFFIILGLSYSFHVVLTVLTSGTEQTDLTFYGRVFSLQIILFVNSILLYFALAITSLNITKLMFIWSQSMEKSFLFFIEILKI